MFKRFKLSNIKITKEHKNFFTQNGYILFSNIFKLSEIKKLDQSIEYFADKDWHNIMNPDRIEFLMAQSSSQFNKLKSQNDKIDFVKKAKDTAFLYKSYLLDIRVKTILIGLTNQKFVGLMTHVIFKHAGSKFSKSSWFPHQDNSYAQMQKNCYITTNLFVDNANKKNGTIYCYPGSHKVGLKDYKKYISFHAKSSRKPGNKTLMKLDENNRIDVNVKKGDYLLMNGNLVHGSYANTSKNNSRHLLSFNYGVEGKKFNSGITAQRKAIKFT